MTFVSGSHRLGYLGSYAISDKSERAVEAMIKEKGLSLQTHGAAKAGA